MINKKTLAVTLQIIISILFLVSAYAKLYPSPYFAISTFEVKQLYPMGFSAQMASYFSRTLIGIEIALGILILIPNYLRKITIPATIFLLAVFIIQLTYEVIKNGNNSNCGCFGELIPMTPIEAIIKNIVAIALLILLRKKMYQERMSNFWINTTLLLGSILAIFMIAPMRNIVSQTPIQNNPSDTDIHAVPLITKENDSIVSVFKNDEKTISEDSIKKVSNEKVLEPKNKKSGYADLYSDIDNGKKILCFFAAGCEHCQQTAKELTELGKKNKNFPKVRIAFMDEDVQKIPEFFKFAGKEYEHKVIDIISFWTKLGEGKTTPGILYLWNGNVIKEYNGIAEKAFNKKEFEKIINQKYN